VLEHYYAVIMAGGGGTRLWPLSRSQRPKQMLSLFDERTLFQTSVQRLDGIFPPERIFVVTVREQAEALHAQMPDIPFENFLIEPLPRGTASVVGLAALALRQRNPQAVMAVLTADHHIADEDLFGQLLQSAYDLAQDNLLVTLGIEPTFPATGFGYIQRGAHIGRYRDMDAYRVLRFTEKPGEEQARQMLATGDHSWNSGMFVWRVGRIWAEFETHMPDLASALKVIEADWDTPALQDTVARVWQNLSIETIDYGIMEKATQVAVIPAAGLGWSDVGSWDSLFEVISGDEYGNIIMGGEHIGLETRQSLVYVEQEHRLIVTIGIENLVLVDTGDVLLVCRKDQAQRVRQVVSQLKQHGHSYI
jgi:mannose-1-phosphate guanylyltransferase